MSLICRGRRPDVGALLDADRVGGSAAARTFETAGTGGHGVTCAATAGADGANSRPLQEAVAVETAPDDAIRLRHGVHPSLHGAPASRVKPSRRIGGGSYAEPRQVPRRPPPPERSPRRGKALSIREHRVASAGLARFWPVVECGRNPKAVPTPAPSASTGSRKPSRTRRTRDADCAHTGVSRIRTLTVRTADGEEAEPEVPRPDHRLRCRGSACPARTERSSPYVRQGVGPGGWPAHPGAGRGIHPAPGPERTAVRPV